MREIVSNPDLAGYCGLYCGACHAYLRERCPGCHDNKKAAWCKVRSCCQQERYASCADCRAFTDPKGCKKFSNFVSKVFSFLFRSDRAACIGQIRQLGIQGHADNMAEQRRHTIKR